ncbi:MAG: tetratricopeptide repeat protein [Bacteroidia bacterium]
MKDFTQKILPLAISAIMVLNACSVKNNFSRNSYNVNPNPLMMQGDSVKVTITGKVPAKSINSKAIIDFQPYFKTASGKEIALKKVTIKGHKAKGNADITLNTGFEGAINYTDKIPYTEDMRRGQLYPRFTFKGAEVPVGKEHMVEGTIATAGLLSWDDKVIITADDYKVEQSTKSVSVYFLIDNAKFNPNFRLGKEIDNKKQLVILKDMLKKDPNWVANKVSLNSFASPDGELRRNEDLAKNRSQSSNAYMRKELKKLGFAEVNDDNFQFGYNVSEDWAGFAKLVEESNLSDKVQMLNIINNRSISDEERENQLKTNHAKSWKVCADKLLPKLRRSELVITGSKPMKTDAQLLAMQNQLNQLTAIELHHLYYIVNDKNKRREILEAYLNKDQNNWIGYNDLGAFLLTNGDLAGAERNLNKANELSPNNPNVVANLGALKRAQGDWRASERIFNDAARLGANVSYNLGLIAIKKGDFAAAVNNFNKSGVKDFNTALAQLLNGDANGAKATIDNLNPDELKWNHFYLRAICGARMNNQDVLTTNLARAVALNGNVRNLAKTDAEFIKFFNNPLFEGAIR